jgi:hypothetical protein
MPPPPARCFWLSHAISMTFDVPEIDKWENLFDTTLGVDASDPSVIHNGPKAHLVG